MAFRARYWQLLDKALLAFHHSANLEDYLYPIAKEYGLLFQVAAHT